MQNGSTQTVDGQRLATILVPLDGSEFGEKALPHAEALARASGARLLLVRSATTLPTRATYPTAPARKAISEAEEYLSGIRRDLAGRGIAVEIAIPYADAEDGITDEARRGGADLIVMATHGRGGLGRWLFGSVAEQVLIRSHAPVLLVRGWKPQPERVAFGDRPVVLAPLDGSEFAEEALPEAARLAGVLDGRLVLVRAVYPPSAALVDQWIVSSYLQEELEEDEADARKYLNEVAERLRRQGRDVEIEMRVGAPHEVIRAAGRDREAAMVVMATHGRTGLSRFALGSVANVVLRNDEVPLLLVRPEAAQGAEPGTAESQTSTE